MYDIIVIGAGPAGCTAAKTLSERGYRVLLVEKRALPRCKSCSGILIRKTLELVRRYFGAEVPDFTMCTPVRNRGMIFTDDMGREYRFEQDGWNVWRSTFDHWLSRKAAESGTEIRDRTAVIFCEEQENRVSVTLRGETVYTVTAGYVLDCEGAAGSVKTKLLGAATPHITTFQTFNDGNIRLDPHYFYAYLQPELSEYDAWFNVKDGQLVLGVSVKNPENIRLYYDRFLTYMKEQHGLILKKQIRSEKWLMPHVRPGCRIDYGIGRILFAGEVAGFLNPMGEGISAGMESGYCVASAVSDHFHSAEKIYAAYKQRTETLREYMQRQWSLVAGMSDKFSKMKE